MTELEQATKAFTDLDAQWSELWAQAKTDEEKLALTNRYAEAERRLADAQRKGLA